MSCPICDNKPMNCDCTSLEKEQFYEIEDLSAEVEKLRDWQKRALEFVELCPIRTGERGREIEKLLEEAK